MARQIIANGETGGNVRDKMNDNYRELYQKTDSLEGLTENRVDTIIYDNTTFAFTTTDNYFTADILNNIKVAVMDTSNNVKYYLDNSDVRFKENGEAANIYGYKTDTTVNIGGTDYTVLASDFGTVRVETPKFYWKYDRLANGNNKYSVSAYYFAGSERFKAFRAYNATTSEVEDTDYSYVDRYEGVLFDTSENRCVNGVYIDVNISADSGTKAVTFNTPVQYLAAGDVLKDTTGVLGAADAVYTVASVTLNASKEATGVVLNEAINDVSSGTSISLRNEVDTVNDYVMSVSGYKPISNVSQADFNTLYQNWSGDVSTGLHSFWHWQMQLLMTTINYGTLNVQTALGNGKLYNSGDYRYVSVTGLGDANGISDAVDSTIDDQFAGYSVLNGIEQAWGNLFNAISLFELNEWIVKITDNNNLLNDRSSFDNTGIELPHSSGYYGEVVNFKALLPASVDGGSSDGIGDYFSQNSGSRVGFVGGTLYYSTAGGPACFRCRASASDDFWARGGRGGFFKS